MRSLFVTGTDTDVGKTVISAGLARALSDDKVNVGVMKPFAAAEFASSSEFQSEDTEILARAARVSDPPDALNPQFFPIPASPFTASKTLNVKVSVDIALQKFRELEKSHDVMIVEGMGGIMTPILKDYAVADLIRDMSLPTVIIIRSKIGTINHTMMTDRICRDYNLQVAGIIINDYDTEGYPSSELRRDIEELTGRKVLGVIPRQRSLDADSVARAIQENIDMDALLSV